jgi:hypothetical protein
METFKSKIGFFALFFLLFFIGLTTYLIVEMEILPGIILLAFTIFYIWLFYNTKYTISKESLYVGPWGPSIPLKDITSIGKPGNFYFSSPALALKRIAIKHLNGCVYISPKNIEEFTAILKRKCINLENE